MDDPRELLRRYLRQRHEFGEHDLVLGDAQPAALLRLVRGNAPLRSPAPPLPASRPVGFPEIRPAVPASELVQIGSLAELHEVALGCPRCRLAGTRTRVVFGDGRPDAQVMVVGEAPGADEDRTGKPFVGRAGKLLTLMLQAVGFEREQVYICNVIKCRPPQNRNPQPDEVATCSPYLLRQVELVQPEVILAFGTFAAQTLLGTRTPIGQLRGQVHEFHGVPLIPTYHPAAVLRNPGWTRPVWDDLQRLRSLLSRD